MLTEWKAEVRKWDELLLGELESLPLFFKFAFKLYDSFNLFAVDYVVFWEAFSKNWVISAPVLFWKGSKFYSKDYFLDGFCFYLNSLNEEKE